MDDILGDKELVTKPEETDDFIRIPVRTCEVTATIDISKKEGISALYCGKEKQVRTYLFRKDKDWTMEKAKTWVKEHEGKSANEISQEAIIDEIDYLMIMIDKEGLSDKAKESFKELLKRCPADDIAVEIKAELPSVVTVTSLSEKTGAEITDILESIKRISK